MGVQLLLRPRLCFSREAKIYAFLFAYACLSTTWAPDAALALNSLFPMLDFLILVVLFDSLITHFPARAVIVGSMCGFLAGAGVYTAATGFPFALPDEFSYNSLAVMYLHGVFLSFAVAVITGRNFLPLALALVAVVHVMATTSIKTNFGIAIGLLTGTAFHLRGFGNLLRANLLALMIAAGALTYVVFSNPAVAERLEYGVARLTIGLKVLQARDDTEGYSGFAERLNWARDAASAVAKNPVFGAGIEAFRHKHGISSHSTPVDIAYNLGLIGLISFYAVLASVAVRVFARGFRSQRALRALVLASMACYAFVSLSGTFFYNAFMAATIGIGVALLRAAQSSSQEH
jgi:hypothetical protein